MPLYRMKDAETREEDGGGWGRESAKKVGVDSPAGN